MELIRGIHNIRQEHFGCVLTIGNFDGIHMGHRQVLGSLVERSKFLGVPTVVMVFEPQPIESFSPDKAPARITRLRDKFLALRDFGIDRLLCVRFCDEFSMMPPHDFVEKLLVEKLGVKHLVIGDDFRFGKDRKGNFETLLEAGVKHGFDVENTHSFCLSDYRVSSTGIREELAQGDFARVTKHLGRPFTLTGKVSHGQKLGRQLGFPTANIHLKCVVPPLTGVYVVKVTGIGAQSVSLPAVANIGYRPTAKGKDLLLEVHLLDYSQDLYKQRLTVEPLKKLRDEMKFESLDALKAQVQTDMQRARSFFGLIKTI